MDRMMTTKFAYAQFLHTGGSLNTPFDPGMSGSYFVYLSNRNLCTTLFDPLPLNDDFYHLLYASFEPGYATLFVLEKWMGMEPGGSMDEEPQIPSELHSFKGETFCVFQDPAETFMGSSAIVFKHRNIEEIIKAAVSHTARHGIRVLCARIVDSLTWH